MKAKDVARLGEIAAVLPPETEMRSLNVDGEPAWVWHDTGLPLIICRHGNDAWTCDEKVCEKREWAHEQLKTE